MDTTIRQALKKAYFRVKANWFVWSYIANHRARKYYDNQDEPLSKKLREIATTVEQCGIAFVPYIELFPNGPTLEELKTYGAQFEATAVQKTKKKFLLNYWDTDVVLDFENPFVQIALSSQLLGIANTYLNMWTRLQHYTLNKTLPVPSETKAEHSQRWHRDPQEKRLLKVFLYLTDVGLGSGPFTYVRFSTYGKKYGNLFPQHPPEGSYPPEGAVENAVAREDIFTATALAGTLIFCDTTGLHKGGYATMSERLMYTATYTAPSYVDTPWYVKAPDLAKNSKLILTSPQRFALGLID